METPFIGLVILAIVLASSIGSADRSPKHQRKETSGRRRDLRRDFLNPIGDSSPADGAPALIR